MYQVVYETKTIRGLDMTKILLTWMFNPNSNYCNDPKFSDR